MLVNLARAFRWCCHSSHRMLQAKQGCYSPRAGGRQAGAQRSAAQRPSRRTCGAPVAAQCQRLCLCPAPGVRHCLAWNHLNC